MALLPEPLYSATKLETATRDDIPSVEALNQWLLTHGVDTTKWGVADGTKPVASYYKEIKGDEAGLELWRRADKSEQAVRVTHVLRAKVTSPDSYRRGVFLFNTWQQFGDGRKRTRNGLLSEKLTMSEMPFEQNIHDICQRAVTEEEMQRVVESAFKIGPGTCAPVFDSKYVCPIKVLSENFVDHTIELEESKSYPGLLTMYHLYTVDIVCSNLPSVDFNTLEFDHEDANGKRKLKYVHAWVWLEWSQIQRYLFEGSELKEWKTKGSFPNSEALNRWLSQFDLPLQEWGTGKNRSVTDLFNEVEKEQTNLELWGRHDGVPLLMRVVHVVQLKVCSSDSRLTGKFLLQKWAQTRDGQLKYVNRLMAQKLSAAQLPFDEHRFSEAAKAAVSGELSFLADAYFSFDPDSAYEEGLQPPSGVAVKKVEFLGHRFEVEESPSFKGMYTMYHLYTMEVVCENLPMADFTSISYRRVRSKGEPPNISGWHWTTWEETLDVLHARTATLERRDILRLRGLESSAQALNSLSSAIQKLGDKVPNDDPDVEKVKQLILQLQREMIKLRATSHNGNQVGDNEDFARMFPPSMISKMAAQTITSEQLLEQAEWAQVTNSQTLHQGEKKDTGKQNCFKSLFCGPGFA